MSDLLDSLCAHIGKMHWVEKGCYLHDRGWSGSSDLGWLSPHDGASYTSDDGVLMEMLREAEGNPTPRSGIYLDPRRGELKA